MARSFNNNIKMLSKSFDPETPKHYFLTARFQRKYY